MKYQSILFVVATKNQPISIETDLGAARRAANAAALNNPGVDYCVYEWPNGERWQDHKTQYAYRGFYAETRDEYIQRMDAEMRRNAEYRAAANREWSRLDSERGHANAHTAHLHMVNYKLAEK
jgi:hypothetical protein